MFGGKHLIIWAGERIAIGARVCVSASNGNALSTTGFGAMCAYSANGNTLATDFDAI